MYDYNVVMSQGEELLLGGIKYISSKRASLLTGYTKDYIGQLCRGKKVNAQLVGRTWYVEEESLLAHKQDGTSRRSKIEVDTEKEERQNKLQEELNVSYKKEPAYNFAFSADESPLIPDLRKKQIPQNQVSVKINTSSNNQNKDSQQKKELVAPTVLVKDSEEGKSTPSPVVIRKDRKIGVKREERSYSGTLTTAVIALFVVSAMAVGVLFMQSTTVYVVEDKSSVSGSVTLGLPSILDNK